MHGHNNLPPVGVTPLLVAAFLTDDCKAVLFQNLNHLPGIANREMSAHVNATSNTFAPGGTETCDGSNQRFNASFAF